MNKLTFSLFAVTAVTLAACGDSSTSLSAPVGDASVPDTSTGVADDSGAGGGGDDGGATDDGGGTGGNQDGGDAGDVTADTACADTAKARCARNDACSLSTYNAVHYGDLATCLSRVKAACLVDVGAPGTGATPAGVEGCAQAIATESCVDYFGDNPPPACGTAAGSLASGAACIASGQCTSTYCAIPQFATCGTCAAIPAPGDPCAVSAECGSRGGLTCFDGKCVAYVASGGACDKDAQCGIGLTCVGATKTAAGKCAAAGKTIGATCDANGATGPRCDATLDLVCEAAACAAEAIVASTHACGEISGGVTRCGSSGTCVLSADDAGTGVDSGAPTSGTCLAAAADNAACDTANGPACMPPAKCVVTSDGSTAGTCMLPSSATCP